MVTIQIDEKTEVGKVLLEVARLLSNEKEGVKVLASTKCPNEETMEVFGKTDASEDLIETNSHNDLLKKLYS